MMYKQVRRQTGVSLRVCTPDHMFTPVSMETAVMWFHLTINIHLK